MGNVAFGPQWTLRVVSALAQRSAVFNDDLPGDHDIAVGFNARTAFAAIERSYSDRA